MGSEILMTPKLNFVNRVGIKIKREGKERGLGKKKKQRKRKRKKKKEEEEEKKKKKTLILD